MKVSDYLHIFLLFAFSASISTASIPPLYELRESRQFEDFGTVDTLPPDIFRALTFEFEGFAADYLLMQTMTFLGKKIGADQQLSMDEWQRVHRMLVKITDLDQKFWDPYLLAESMLTWEAGMFEETNALLLKAAESRPHDFRPFYFMGFNAFFFQKDFPTAATYIAEAAKRPSAPFYLAGLAARLGMYGNQTDVSIVFLEEMLLETADPGVRNYIEKRLAALKIIYELEKKVSAFKKTYDTLPSGLAELVQKGLLAEIPQDPYGGDFVMLPDGRIYTTSELVSKENAETSPPEKQ